MTGFIPEGEGLKNWFSCHGSCLGPCFQPQPNSPLLLICMPYSLGQEVRLNHVSPGLYTGLGWCSSKLLEQK